VIVMLTKFQEKGVKKANMYWPKSKGGSSNYGEIVVVNRGAIKMTGITITFLDVSKMGEESKVRQIYHLHYTEWPDFGVPSSTLVLRSLLTCTDLYASLGASKNLTGAIICHCSAGIGRTGTFIATDLALSYWNVEEEKPNVYDIVLKLRELRSGMVQSDSQYLFIYKVINDYIYSTNHPSKPMRYSSLQSISLIPDELKVKETHKKNVLRRACSLSSINANNVNTPLHK